jgi:thiol-disulfide isomerase/thioredoxin
VRVVARMGTLALFLTLAGCSVFDKKPQQAKSNPPADRPDRPFWQIDPNGGASANAIIADRTVPPRDAGGILAGQVVDSYNRKPPPTYIQVVCKDDKQPAGAPIDVAADSMGYFTIQGLQPGKTYELIARAREGDRVLAGSTQARPPNPKLLIRVSEDLVGANSRNGVKPIGTNSQDKPQPDWPSPADKSAGNPPIGVEIMPPAGGRIPAAGGGPKFNGDRSRIADRDDVARAPAFPLIDINGGPGAREGSTVVPGRDGSTFPSDASVSGGVPSCKLTGDRLEDFALKDLNGDKWEFRKDRRGRLVLIDFWGTWCMPCREAIWHLNAINNVYRDYGLEVIGIAEEQGEVGDHVRKVDSIRQRQGINYRLLLGGGLDHECPVRTEFGIKNYPTLVLLDDSGRILWRSEGLSEAKLRELDGIIRQQLRIR